MDPARAAEGGPPFARLVELEGGLDSRERISAAGDCLVERHVGEGPGEQAGLAEALRHLEGGARVDLGGREIAQVVKAPGEASLDLDARRNVGPDRFERRAEDVDADAESLLVRPHPAQEHERPRPLGALRTRDLLQQRADRDRSLPPSKWHSAASTARRAASSVCNGGVRRRASSYSSAASPGAPRARTERAASSSDSRDVRVGTI